MKCLPKILKQNSEEVNPVIESNVLLEFGLKIFVCRLFIKVIKNL